MGTLLFGGLYLFGPPPGDEADNLSLEEGRSGEKVSYTRLQNLRQQAEVSIELKRQKAVMEQTKNHGILSPKKPNQKRLHKTELVYGSGPAEKDIDQRRRYGSVNLDQRMDEFLAKKQEFEEMEKAKRELFVKSFIEEARVMGYNVVIDEDYEIKSVTRIKSN